MTIFREDCGYEPLTAERAPEFGVAPEDAGLWFIESEYGVGPLLPGGDYSGCEKTERLIPNTLARLSRGAPILIGVSVPKADG